ncbi:hypothetical protein JL720_17301 [Aureococcus anophagefferens]|nr:hypothetical protein JL720_17301 [Aureococcus anophagefferens]
MKDIIPSWLEDPSAYAQPANLDMSTVIVVALTNLWVGIVCVTFFEVFRRRNMRIFSPKATLCPDVPAGAPRARREARRAAVVGAAPCASARTTSCATALRRAHLPALHVLSLKIFGSFAPYAFIVLLPVNASVSYWPGRTSSDDDDGATSSKDNTFNRLSMSAMPVHDKRMWAHCVGCFLLTFLSMHFLARECRWYTRLRHRFLTQRDDVRQRTILVRQVPRELRSSDALAAYFAKLYPGKVVGAVERAQHHAAQQRTFDERIARERRRQALMTAVGKPDGRRRKPRTRTRGRAARRRPRGGGAVLGDALCGAADVDSATTTAAAAAGGAMYEEWSDGADLSFSDKLLVGFGLKRERDVFHAATPGGMVASMAPEPRDVFWKNAELSGSSGRRGAASRTASWSCCSSSTSSP